MDKWKKLFKLYVRALPLSIATTLVAIHTFVLCLMLPCRLIFPLTESGIMVFFFVIALLLGPTSRQLCRLFKVQSNDKPLDPRKIFQADFVGDIIATFIALVSGFLFFEIVDALFSHFFTVAQANGHSTLKGVAILLSWPLSFCLIYAFLNSFRTRLDGLDKQSQASVGAVSPGKDRYHFAALIVIALIFVGGLSNLRQLYAPYFNEWPFSLLIVETICWLLIGLASISRRRFLQSAAFYIIYFVAPVQWIYCFPFLFEWFVAHKTLKGLGGIF